MTGGAGAGTAAGVVEEDVEVFGNVKKGHGLAVVAIGQRAELEFDGFTLGLKGHANEFVGGDDFVFCHGRVSILL
uniref:Uncharacterized protein n=1 Tax=mine drainage metagenome TaxID=410659 RepID=E6QKY8_9ZZZZ